MTRDILQSVVYPSDFSPAGQTAFAHALRIAVAARSALHLLHVGDRGEYLDWSKFPQVRKLLILWGLLAEGAAKSEVGSRLGLRVEKAFVGAHDPVHGLVSYVGKNSCDLLVAMTHGRSGLQKWLHGSVAETSARQAYVPTLLLREGQSGFVDPDSGAARLNRVLVPFDGTLTPTPAWRLSAALAALFSSSCDIKILHVGEPRSGLGRLPAPIEFRQGPVAETIADYAREIDADLITMPMPSRAGLLDAMHRSVISQVIHLADQPVLTAPTDDNR